jgi:hypothetical protein
MCQFKQDSPCPNAVLIWNNIHATAGDIKEMKEAAEASRVEFRSEIKGLHARVDALIYWVAGLFVTNLLALGAMAAQLMSK